MFRRIFIAIFLVASLGVLGFGLASRNRHEVKVEIFCIKQHWATLSAFNGRVYFVHNWLIGPNHQRVAKEFWFGQVRFMSSVQPPLRVTLVAGPFWFPSLLFTIVAGTPLFFIWRRKLKRKLTGLCVECGYNLTGTAEPRCPECGRRVSESKGTRLERFIIARSVPAVLLLVLIGSAAWPIYDSYFSSSAVAAANKKALANAQSRFRLSPTGPNANQWQVLTDSGTLPLDSPKIPPELRAYYKRILDQEDPVGPPREEDLLYDNP